MNFINSSRITILDIPFDPVTSGSFSEKVRDFLDEQKLHTITTPNPEILLESQKNTELKMFLQKSDLSIPDGIGILWAATFLKAVSTQNDIPLAKGDSPVPEQSEWFRAGGYTRANQGVFSKTFTALQTLSWVLLAPKKIRTVLPERVTGVDSLISIAKVAAEKQKKIFLLGGLPGSAEGTKQVLLKKFPNLPNIEIMEGRAFTDDDQKMIESINAAKSEIFFVAFGCPKQELWIKTYIDQLPNIQIVMGVGGSFDFISGRIKRAPTWMKNLGIEWLYRLLQQPKTRIKRIWNAVVVFPWRVLNR